VWQRTAPRWIRPTAPQHRRGVNKNSCSR
jgi:hypothetical protein